MPLMEKAMYSAIFGVKAMLTLLGCHDFALGSSSY